MLFLGALFYPGLYCRELVVGEHPTLRHLGTASTHIALCVVQFVPNIAFGSVAWLDEIEGWHVVGRDVDDFGEPIA